LPYLHPLYAKSSIFYQDCSKKSFGYTFIFKVIFSGNHILKIKMEYFDYHHLLVEYLELLLLNLIILPYP
jgi:hypothetical protein